MIDSEGLVTAPKYAPALTLMAPSAATLLFEAHVAGFTRPGGPVSFSCEARKNLLCLIAVTG